MNRTVDPTNTKIGQDQQKEISISGDPEVVNETTIETVPGPGFEDLAELERFMNEDVKIFVYEPMEEGHEHVIQVKVNGKNQFIIRGKPQTVKRKYVEVLARARRVMVSASGYKDPNGEAKNIVNINSSLQFPFQVLEDPSRNGGAWLQKILSEN